MPNNLLFLKGVGFKKVSVASGTLNFFGDGWPYHKIYRALFGSLFDFDGATFVSKTTTLLPRQGNMPLDGQLQPRMALSKEKLRKALTSLFHLDFSGIVELFTPDCIRINFLKAMVLNSVGLSGPGLEYLLKQNKWQQRTEPFFISFMSFSATLEEKLKEARDFVDLIKKERKNFKASFGVQVNISCPNTGHPVRDMIRDALEILKIISELNVPIEVKIGVADSDLNFLRELQDSGLCDCIVCSNTIPWGKIPERIDWRSLFGTSKSPLEHLGGGGLSGKLLFLIVLDWLKNVRAAGITMPIKVGGGILSAADAREVFRHGADAIEIGSVAILRPWRVSRIVRVALGRSQKKIKERVFYKNTMFFLDLLWGNIKSVKKGKFLTSALVEVAKISIFVFYVLAANVLPQPEEED